jgi:hypothetical protein
VRKIAHHAADIAVVGSAMIKEIQKSGLPGDALNLASDLIGTAS